MLDFQPQPVLDRSRSSLTLMRMSSEAREAVERARRRGGYFDDGLTLLDIGLITSQSNREGMVMRRTRNVSLDDDGVRPFITLHVQPAEADQIARDSLRNHRRARRSSSMSTRCAPICATAK